MSKKIKSVRFHNNIQITYPSETIGFIEIESNSVKHRVDSITPSKEHPGFMEWRRGKHQGAIGVTQISHLVYYDAE